MSNKKILLLVGIIPPFECKEEYLEQMKEYYVLKAKDALPDLDWSLKILDKLELENYIRGDE